MLNLIIWWVGAATLALATVYGLAEGGIWLLDKTIKAFGLWPDAYEMMRRMYREKRGAALARQGFKEGN